MQQIGVDGDFSSFLHSADLVVYGSFLEEQSFPPILVQAMCLGKIIIAPDLAMITNYVCVIFFRFFSPFYLGTSMQ